MYQPLGIALVDAGCLFVDESSPQFMALGSFLVDAEMLAPQLIAPEWRLRVPALAESS